MKPGRIIGIILGLLMMFFAVGAYFSGEKASTSQEGKIMIVVSLIFGFLAFINNAFPKNNEVKITTVNNELKCPHCAKKVEPEYKVCPYCQTALHQNCPKCGKEVKSEFNVCPYCGESLSK